MTARVSRRQRLHDATSEEIKAATRAVLARQGPRALTLRAVARELELTPSALYRYFPSRDALLTAVAYDAYDAIGVAVEQSVARAQDSLPEEPCAGILAAVHAFRRWALDHPEEYGLIYGTPVPGYQALSEDTMDAALRITTVLLGLLGQAVVDGAIDLPADTTVPPVLRRMFGELAAHDHRGTVTLPVSGWMIALQFWTVLYGAINAEVFARMPPSMLEHSGEFFDHTMRLALRAMGVRPECLESCPSPPF